MTCAVCGSEVEEGAGFCSHCGAAVTVRAAPPGTAPPGTAPPGTAPPGTAPPGEPPPAAPPEPTPWSTSTIAPYPAPPGANAPFGFAPPPYGAGYGAPSYGAVARTGSRLAPFGAPLAGWWQRVGALILDGLVIGIPFGVLYVAAFAAFGHTVTIVTTELPIQQRVLPGGVTGALFALFFVVSGLYFSLLNGKGTGQTPGNRAPGIGVRDLETGQLIGAGRGFLRWFVRAFLYAAFVVPGVLNDLYPLWDPHSQTLADKAARSVMIRV